MVTLYSLPACVQCTATKRFLDSKGTTYKVVDMSTDDEAADMVRGLGYQQAPVVVTDSGEHWGGFNPGRLSNI